MIILIRIECQPEKSPILFSQYIMDDLRFNTVYRQIFTRDDTLRIQSSINDASYNLEVYLPLCKITVQYNTQHVNAHRLMYQSDFYGNIDILQHISEQF